ncbi:MAG: N-acetyltransferase [bacterium]|nr:N-acetyltransferase [bacterium]
MIIRQEIPEDYQEVYNLVKKSFTTTSFSDGSEPDYVNELRQKDSFIPKLSLIAVDNNKILGQIVLSKTEIDSPGKNITELLLSPICVHPDHFRKGIARELMEKAFRIAIEMGYSAVFLCGDSNFYNKMGFRATYEFDIYHRYDKTKNADWCMVREFKKGILKEVTGTVDIV